MHTRYKENMFILEYKSWLSRNAADVFKKLSRVSTAAFSSNNKDEDMQ